MGVNGVNPKEVVVVQGGVPVAGAPGNGEDKKVSVYGTEIIQQNDVALKPDTSVPTNLPSAPELAAYFGENQADNIQDEYRDIKSDLDMQVKEFKALYPDFKLDLPQLDPYTKYFANKKGAKNYRDQFVNYKAEVEHALTVAKFQAKQQESTSLKEYISQETDAIMLNDDVNTEAAIVNNNFNAKAIIDNDNKNAESINRNVDQEGAATRGAVSKDGDMTRNVVQKDGDETRNVVQKDGDETRNVVQKEADRLNRHIDNDGKKTRKLVREEAKDVIKNNNRQTDELLNPSPQRPPFWNPYMPWKK